MNVGGEEKNDVDFLREVVLVKLSLVGCRLWGRTESNMTEAT